MTINYFEDSLQHILAELERIDLLIAARVAHARQIYTQDEQFQGLYISEEEVDALLNQPIGQPRWVKAQTGLLYLAPTFNKISAQIEQQKKESLNRGIELRLHSLQQLFGLDRFDIDVLLICLAVELDLRYERLYAYLQDDVTRKRPSVDLALKLLTTSTKAGFKAQARFGVTASLFRNRLLELIEDPSQPYPPLPAKYLKLDNRIVQYLLNSDESDERIRSFAKVYDPQEHFDALPADINVKKNLGAFVQNNTAADRIIVYLQGSYGVGKQSTAEALCREHGYRLIIVNLELLVIENDSFWTKALALIQREAGLQHAAIYWKYFDLLLGQENKKLYNLFIRNLDQRPKLTFLSGETPWEPWDELRDIPFARLEILKPNFSKRIQIWSAALNGSGILNADVDIAALGSKFKFTGGQILDAAATAKNLIKLKYSEDAESFSDDFYSACRLHSNQKLAGLGRKIIPRYKWEDIILPHDRLEQLQEICNHVKYRDQVYGEWGFDRKLSLGKGLSVLFSGPSGTGKTMAAEIIAGELGLELYKIDLSTVVSKYIGETERNLSKVFTEAETSNAILFFDEADALFGKRSEVKDSHDRYANIETGYLLQRMEEYQGVVILASNLRKNMDEAFMRRLHFTIEFPFPNATDRRRIWEGVWPNEVPMESGLALDFMAENFEMSGGSIRNIALSAAFLAAGNDNIISMTHLLNATKREYRKMGKVIADKNINGYVRPV